MSSPQFHFITGRLAESALRTTLRSLESDAPFEYTVQVLPITVAALLTPAWIAPRLKIPAATTRIILPGYCDGDLSPLRALTDVPIEIGPKDLRRLPEFFGKSPIDDDFGEWDIAILAEINHAPRLSLADILARADQMRSDGATLIDVGCEPNSHWRGVAATVAALKSSGHRVSIDSLNPNEIGPAVDAGAELVLSVNSSNREQAVDWGCEVVVIPDDIRRIETMEETLDFLAVHQVPFRIDPILEPIGMGFAASLKRYSDARQRWPEAEIMMGIGNLTELTDVDSAGVNLILLAICQELGIRSVLTTEVINWARSSVKECDVARRLVHYAVRHRIPPKHLSDQLLMLRDPKIVEFGDEHLDELAANIKDNNFRVFAESGEVHLVGNHLHLADSDPFAIFDQLAETKPRNLDPSHAFYLGFEMCKAMTALQLGKQYTQDESLNWGLLTQTEITRHRLNRPPPRPA